MAKKTSKPIRVRILVGQTFVPLFLSEDEFDKFQVALRKKQDGWMTLQTTNEHEVDIRLSEVAFLEKLTDKAPFVSDDSIPIKHLAEAMGVHPTTITRLFPNTLLQASEGTRNFRRATKETADALLKHLKSQGKRTPSKREIEQLFAS